MSGIKKKLPSHINNIKVLKDLGTETSKNRRVAEFECPYCEKSFKARVDQIKSNKTKSCGCARKMLQIKKRTKHGDCDVNSETHGIRSSWSNMKARCLNKNAEWYHRYGGRGISVYKEWNASYLVFKEWALANGWAKGLQIDRIDVDGNYEPDNCRWVTHIENCQSKNQRPRKIGKSGIRGVSKASVSGMYFGQKSIYGKRYSTNFYNTPQEAKAELDLIIDGVIR